MSDERATVLVVDDTPENIQILRELLRADYKVKAATDGDKALGIARREPHPNIILLDVMMPGLSGYEVCRQLKADPLTAEIPVVFITGKTDAEDEQRGLELGAVDYVTKPFNPTVVQARVRTHLAHDEKRRILRRENEDLRQRVSAGFREISEAELRSMIEAGEGDQIEFKSTLRWNLHSDKADKKIENACLKTVAAYLNGEGGVLLVGVDDSGRALGLDQDRFASEDRLLLHWNSLLKAHIGIEFAPLVRSVVRSLDDRRVLLIQCLRSPRPAFFRRENDEAFFVRAGNGTQQLRPSEVLAYIDQRKA